MHQLIIKNGIVVDGTGSHQRQTDIAINDGMITTIGDLHDIPAKKIIDAQGMFVTPGFVDIQNHSDAYWAFFKRPEFDSLVAQGITTIVVGNCGASLAPLLSRNALLAIQKWHDVAGVNTNWVSFAEYLDEIGKKKYGANIASLVGYSTLRRGLLGDDVRALLPEEMETAKEALRSSIRDGAFGMSTGLSYAHEAIIGEAELIELAKTVAEEQGMFSVHLRSEAAEVMEALNEALNFADKAGAGHPEHPLNLKISHFKIRGSENWQLMPHAIAELERAYQKYGNVHFDLYPYDFTWQVLYSYLPRWSYEGGRDAMIANLKDPIKRGKILAYLNSRDVRYSDLYIASTALVLNVAGKRVGEIARRHDTSSEEVMLAIIENGGSDVLAFEQNVDMKQVEELLVHPLSIIGTDGYASGTDTVNSEDLVHPRCFGAIPAFLKFSLQKKTITIEDAIQKITGTPAKKIGLQKRGTLVEGNYADIVLFTADVTDKATMQDPFRFPTGIHTVLVNGEATVEQGARTGARPGTVLKFQKPKK
jgi:N-acyl-D-amino-acid deacylase